ncbi:hypothetical protein KFE25_012653 [Diacronema lutheri]|uniref:Uncharacterized protein n=1 Tax=Diacronema lutheri TaxID=2081491 RepID=A0A8J5XC52_DIALT|nr:hypothetical protein KFE25_012653 [Diacronema lutheri]
MPAAAGAATPGSAPRVARKGDEADALRADGVDAAAAGRAASVAAPAPTAAVDAGAARTPTPEARVPRALRWSTPAARHGAAPAPTGAPRVTRFASAETAGSAAERATLPTARVSMGDSGSGGDGGVRPRPLFSFTLRHATAVMPRRSSSPSSHASSSGSRISDAQPPAAAAAPPPRPPFELAPHVFVDIRTFAALRRAQRAPVAQAVARVRMAARPTTKAWAMSIAAEMVNGGGVRDERRAPHTLARAPYALARAPAPRTDALNALPSPRLSTAARARVA